MSDSLIANRRSEGLAIFRREKTPDVFELASSFLNRLTDVPRATFYAKIRERSGGNSVQLEIYGNPVAISAAQRMAMNYDWRHIKGRTNIANLIFVQPIPSRHSDIKNVVPRVNWTRKNMMRPHTAYVNVGVPKKVRIGNITRGSMNMGLPVENVAQMAKQEKFRNKRRTMRTPNIAHRRALQLERHLEEEAELDDLEAFEKSELLR